MEEPLDLYNSEICRLCGEDNPNAELIFPSNESEQCDTEISNLINQYLPLKIKNDEKLPRVICPGCNIQLQSTVQFFDLIIEGQKKLRDLIKFNDKQQKKTTEDELAEQQTGITFQGEDGNLYLMISVNTTANGEPMYGEDNPLSLKMEGLDKPKRKRGRPPKPKIDPNEPPPEINPEQVGLKMEQESEKEEEPDEVDGKRRRRRKLPFRYRGEVVLNEMEKVFREEGVIDEDEEEFINMEGPTNFTANITVEGTETEVIGRLQTKDGERSQEIVMPKFRKFGKPSVGRRRTFNIPTCEICGRFFLTRNKLHAHRLEHKWHFECIECNEKFSNKETLDSHQNETEHKGLFLHEEKTDTTDVNAEDEQLTEIEAEKAGIQVSTCPECQKCFATKENLEDHMRFVHQGIKAYDCTVCDKKFGYHRSLTLHIETEHASVVENNAEAEEKNNEKSGISCDLCGRTFNHASSVLYHKETEHNDDRRYVCNKCDKPFKHKQLLHRHQLVHSDERPFACMSCDGKFKTKANLINHLATHSAEKKFVCDLCGQQFAHKTSLTLHTRWHTGEKPFSCDVCGKSFSQNGNLQEHKRIHTGEKPFVCSICGRRFTTSSQFKIHAKRHDGIRPWQCEFCSKTFLHKDTWKCHVRRHRGERPFTCEFCQRGFTEPWALKKHVRIHTGEKPYVCDVCNKTFADCSNLTKHRKIHRTTEEEDPTEGESVVWQIIDGDIEEEQEQQHIIYVAYDNTEDTEPVVDNTMVTQQMFQQLTQGNRLVLGDGQEVILSTIDGNIPVVIPTGLTEENNTTTYSTDMPCTLEMEGGQMVARINSSEFLVDKSKEKVNEAPLQLMTTEDGTSVQLITNTDADSLINIINN